MAGGAGDGLLSRLTFTEYIPHAAWLVSWALVAAACGGENAARLGGAVLLISAARSLTQPSPRALRALARQEGRRYALRLTGLALAAGLLTLAGLLLMLLIAGGVMPGMLLVLSTGFPARYLLGWVGRPRRRVATFRMSLAGFGLGLLALGALAKGGWMAAAAAFAAREWLALLALAIRARLDPQPLAAEPPGIEVATDEEGWHGFARASYSRARRRLVHRGVRDLLQGFLGPFGGLISRTARGSRLDARLSKLLPQSQVAIWAAGLIAAVSGGSVLLLSGDHWHALAGCALLRMAAYCGATILWGRLSPATA